MTEPKLTPEQVADHRAFLKRVTAAARERVLSLIEPLKLLVADDELNHLMDAAREEVRFEARWRGLELDDDADPAASAAPQTEPPSGETRDEFDDALDRLTTYASRHRDALPSDCLVCIDARKQVRKLYDLRSAAPPEQLPAEEIAQRIYDACSDLTPTCDSAKRTGKPCVNRHGNSVLDDEGCCVGCGKNIEAIQAEQVTPTLPEFTQEDVRLLSWSDRHVKPGSEAERIINEKRRDLADRITRSLSPATPERQSSFDPCEVCGFDPDNMAAQVLCRVFGPDEYDAAMEEWRESGKVGWLSPERALGGFIAKLLKRRAPATELEPHDKVTARTCGWCYGIFEAPASAVRCCPHCGRVSFGPTAQDISDSTPPTSAPPELE